MAYDPVANRLYVASEGALGSGGQIAWVALDGSGGGVLDTGAAPVRSPEGIALDPASRRVYWANSADDTIGWAGLGGGAGGLVDTAGVPTAGIYRLALAGGVLYWSGSEGGGRYLASASVDGSGGGVLVPLLPGDADGLAVDPAAGRLYWLDSGAGGGSLRWTELSGGAGASVPLGAADHEGTGLAFDPALGRAYWGNYGLAGARQEAIGFADLGGATGTISPAVAPVNGAQDPIVIRSPAVTAAPVLSQAGAALSCSSGGWAPDFPSSNVFQSPRSLSYRWSLDGVAIASAAGSSYVATAPGVYGCLVAAANAAGSAEAGASSSATLTPGRLELRGRRRRAGARPGGVARFRVTVLDRGDLGSARARLCLAVPRRARAALRPGRCRSLAPLAPGATRQVTLSVRARRTAAAGAYRLRITLSGAKATKVSLKVGGRGRHGA